jgi:hypothetical protein
MIARVLADLLGAENGPAQLAEPLSQPADDGRLGAVGWPVSNRILIAHSRTNSSTGFAHPEHP